MNSLQEIIDTIKSSKDGARIYFDGGISLKVGDKDALAGELIDWLRDKMGESGTIGDSLEVLENAHFWITFLVASLPDKKEEKR